MSALRAEVSRHGTALFHRHLKWQDSGRAEADLQAACRPPIALATPLQVSGLGTFTESPGFLNFRFTPEALWRPVEFFAGLPAPGQLGPLGQRVAHLELLSERLRPARAASWGPEPLTTAERALAVGLERLWECLRRSQASRRKGLQARLESLFHHTYEREKLATAPLHLARMACLGRALLHATGTDRLPPMERERLQ